MAAFPAVELDRVKEHARRFSRGFTPGQKAVTIVAATAVLAAAIMFFRAAAAPSFAPLFTGLSSADAAAVTAKLSAAKVPYRLAAGGATVLVPAGEVLQERIDLAEVGLPASSNLGLAIMDKEGITASQLTQQADYQRALQGELASTIEAIQGVASATVNLALPAQNAFSLSTPTPTGASVLVRMRPGAVLTQPQVQAIVHLVASSIPGLAASQVTLADGSGNLLAGPGVSQGGAGPGNQSTAYDAAMTAKLQAFLSQVVGPGNAQVAVSSQLNFDKVSTTRNTVQTTPSGAPLLVPTTTSSTKETLSGSGVSAGGVLGATTPVTLPASGRTQYSKTSSSTSYQVGTVTQTIVQAPGSLARQSVAVAVDSAALPRGMSMSALRQELAAAAGINPARGDQITVSALPFAVNPAQAAATAARAAAAAARARSLGALVRTAVVALAVLLVLFLLWRSTRSGGASAAELALTEPPAALEPESASALPPLRESLPPLPSESVRSLIESQPEEMARLLRSWMAEGRSS